MTTKTPRSPHAKPSVLGLGGFKEHGKDALADALEAQGWVKLGMSDTLAKALYILNPLIRSQDTDTIPWDPEGPYADREPHKAPPFVRYADLADRVGYVKAKENPEVRRLLQKLGTEVGRMLISDSVWTDIVARTVRRHVAEGDSVVITGIRYPNELDMIRGDLKGLAYWVDRPGHMRPADSHSSENTLAAKDFDGIILNDGTLADLDAVGRLIDWRDDHGTLQETEGAAGLLNGLSARDIARLEKYSVINPEAAGNHRGEPRTAESEAEAERLNAKYSEQGL